MVAEHPSRENPCHVIAVLTFNNTVSSTVVVFIPKLPSLNCNWGVAVV